MEVNQDIRDFIITYDQAKQICEKYGEDISELEDYEVCELLDKLIDENT